MKTVIIENIITPFEIARFNMLGQSLGTDLLVLFQNQSEANRNWRMNAEDIKFQYKILPDIPVRIGASDLFTLHMNFTAFSELKKFAPDVVVTCGWDSLASYVSYLYCKRYGKKYVLWAGSTVNEPSWRRLISQPLVRLLVKNSDACIAYGTRAKKYLMLLGAAEDKIFIGWNSIDNSLFDARSAMTPDQKIKMKSKLGIKTSLIILYVGQFIKRKGIFDLIAAFSLMTKETRDVTLLMVGSGREESRLIKTCKKNGLSNVIFTGFIDYEQLPKYFAISDLFVLPSSEEVWGLVINEAMACGLPVITTNKVGASVDLVKDGVNGYVVQEQSCNELYSAIRRLVSDKTLRLKMGSASKLLINGFSIDRTAEGVKEAISYAARK